MHSAIKGYLSKQFTYYYFLLLKLAEIYCLDMLLISMQLLLTAKKGLATRTIQKEEKEETQA